MTQEHGQRSELQKAILFLFCADNLCYFLSLVLQELQEDIEVQI